MMRRFVYSIYDDVIEARRKRDFKEAAMAGAKIADRKRQNLAMSVSKRLQIEGLEHGRREMETFLRQRLTALIKNNASQRNEQT